MKTLWVLIAVIIVAEASPFYQYPIDGRRLAASAPCTSENAPVSKLLQLHLTTHRKFYTDKKNCSK